MPVHLMIICLSFAACILTVNRHLMLNIYSEVLPRIRISQSQIRSGTSKLQQSAPTVMAIKHQFMDTFFLPIDEVNL
jgi:hypothetical protein